MTDLVILNGVKWLLGSRQFPFSEYVVEYGNENNNEHDILAMENGLKLHGEAFNVAPSFFQGKKKSALKKLRESQTQADFIIILVNSDAVKDNYTPKVKENESLVFVDIISGNGRILPDKSTQSTSGNINGN